MKKNDKGCYQCRVKNDVGEKLSKVAVLTVSKLVIVMVILLCIHLQVIKSVILSV